MGYHSRITHLNTNAIVYPFLGAGSTKYILLMPEYGANPYKPRTVTLITRERALIPRAHTTKRDEPTPFECLDDDCVLDLLGSIARVFYLNVFLCAGPEISA
jgi:hypothetical protein